MYRAKEIIEFDKTNAQEDYQYMAKGLADEKYHIGYIVVDKPWYSNPSNWTYYIVTNNYKPGGLCGGAIDAGLKQTIVDPNTIEPFTQIAKIKYNQNVDLDTLMVKDFLVDDEEPDNIVAFIGADDKIPVELWD